jgi:hypothetical protein
LECVSRSNSFPSGANRINFEVAVHPAQRSLAVVGLGLARLRLSLLHLLLLLYVALLQLLCLLLVPLL